MKKVKFALVWVLLLFFIQETRLVLHGGYETFVEYSTESSGSAEECIHHQVTKGSSKSRVIEKQKWVIIRDPLSVSSPIEHILKINRILLYRSLLI